MALTLFLLMESVVRGARNHPCFISGTLTDAQGSAISGATVLLKCGRHASQVTTGTLGRFEMEAAPNAQCEITASAHEFRTASRSIRTFERDIELAPIVLQLQEPEPRNGPEPVNPVYLPKRKDDICLEGEVAISPIPVNEDDVLRRAAVILSKVGDAQPLAVAHPDSQGWFKFASVEPGRYVLKVSLSGYPDSQSAPFTVSKNRLTRVNLYVGTDIVVRL
jgi:Carboxypeptidase regulatory-like domain